MKEISLRFGASGHLAGTITMPARSTGLGLLLPSAGFLHRIGPHRLHVRFAREAAAKGIGSIRFDMPGIGDSVAAPTLETYQVQALRAAQEAMELLTVRTGASRYIVAGLCSGADIGYQLASKDDRVVALYMMEPPRLVSGPLSSAFRVVRQLREYGPSFAATRIWQSMADGDLLEPRLGSVDDRSVPAPAEYAAGLRRLTNRGVHICMAYASSTMGEYDLRRLHRQYLAPLGQWVTLKVDVVPRTDHLFTRSEAKQALVCHLAQIMDTVLGIDVDNRANESSKHRRQGYYPGTSERATGPESTRVIGPEGDQIHSIAGNPTPLPRETYSRPEICQITGRIVEPARSPSRKAVLDSVSLAAAGEADGGATSKLDVSADIVQREK